MINYKKEKHDPELEAALKAKKPLITPVWRWVIVAVFLVVAMIGVVKTSRELSSCPFEMDAVFTLRALSNVELAYRDYNEEHRFGTLDALKSSNFVKYGYTEENIAPGYRIEIIPLSSYNNNVHTFNIRMYPDNPSRPCRTFQMGSERRLWEFLPQVNSDIHRPENWLKADYILDLLPPRDHLDWMGDNYVYN